MPLFSERNGYAVKPLQIESMTSELRNRIWNIYSSEISTDILHVNSNYLEEIMDCFGLTFISVGSMDLNGLSQNLASFKKWFMKAEWYQIYDFIEVYLKYLSGNEQKEARYNFNVVLKAENAGYTVIENHVVPITNPVEIASIEQTQQSSFGSVNIHIRKAVELFSKRPSPDYENSIKESISAVESMCCIITGSSGKNATLVKAIKKLKDNGVHIHSCMESAFSSLYNYTSDENGIRHGGIDFSNATAEDAKYMLVSCSAFVNYLIEKWSKVAQ